MLFWLVPLVIYFYLPYVAILNDICYNSICFIITVIVGEDILSVVSLM